MVKTKHQKSNSKRQPQNKKPGKAADISQFRAQLDLLGLQIVQVTADGNCFFRGLADQLDGDQEEHEKYRKMVVQYILKNREMFEPFIEDDVPFDEYCDSMEKDGTWAGHLELQAASLVTHSNICIHRMSSPRWYIRNFDDREARMVHLSYHDEEHYNSVRLKEDTCAGPARPIIIKGDAVPSANSLQAKVLASNFQKRGESAISPGIVKVVMAGSGCENSRKVEKVLVQVSGDVDAAIEFLIAEQAAEENEEPTESSMRHMDSSFGVDEKRNDEQLEEQTEENHNKIDSCSNSTKHSNCSSSQSDDKKIPRNKVCPCGSKKKYKACCGSVAASSSGTRLLTLRNLGRKGRWARRVDLLKLKCPLDLMDCHMTWEHFVFDLHLAETF
ncbi:OTU domain-containing protein 3 isoform X2 [Momordica charantia]|uniref:OTU domain-containing protein 3 isoform X2 n=1 Tax=Momordica charantia TaxID=3673 RepID=A0A6J1BVI3_MOMCH|nr:OTU domain-containing protein 3 isoform X2 [Momordica charantia]XP_022133265.1 OTU domain-containing protein 3 isoform X2 [Momordica charantia]XP_022133266.1 OTU domain-containing protein 3 isoform X2 [Momordica charantia]